MNKKRANKLTGQAAINLLERCLTLTEMAEERMHDARIVWFAYLDNEEANWSNAGCPNDFAHANSFGLSGDECERFLDWCANQRNFWLLCDAGLDDIDAHYIAGINRALLRTNKYP